MYRRKALRTLNCLMFASARTCRCDLGLRHWHCWRVAGDTSLVLVHSFAIDMTPFDGAEVKCLVRLSEARCRAVYVAQQFPVSIQKVIWIPSSAEFFSRCSACTLYEMRRSA